MTAPSDTSPRSALEAIRPFFADRLAEGIDSPGTRQTYEAILRIVDEGLAAPSFGACKATLADFPGIGTMNWCDACGIYFGKDQACPSAPSPVDALVERTRARGYAEVPPENIPSKYRPSPARDNGGTPYYKVLWERDSASLGKCIQDIHNLRAVKEDQRARIAELERELSEERNNKRQFERDWLEACDQIDALKKAQSATVAQEPTQAMIDAGYLAIEQGRGAKSVWLAMRAAMDGGSENAKT